jgi:hypothetical protein
MLFINWLSPSGEVKIVCGGGEVTYIGHQFITGQLVNRENKKLKKKI